MFHREIMKNTRGRFTRPRASTLVITLLVLVVLSTIVVAFMQSMAIERTVARSYANQTRAKFASEAGLNAALQQLRMAMGTNQAYLVGLTNDALNYGPLTVVGVTNLTNLAQLMPLISGDLASLNGFPSPSLTNAISNYINARTNLSPVSTVNVNLRNQLIQQMTNTNTYRAPWVYIPDSAGETNIRFAYVVLDEFARLNASTSKGDARDSATNWFSGPEVLSLHTGGTNLLTPTEATNATGMAYQKISLHTIGQAFSSRSNYEQKKHLLTVNDAWSFDVIPVGYYSNTNFIAFPDGGKPKFNLNDLATNTVYGATASERAENIAGIIASNLPNFGKRDLGLQTEDPTGEKYLNRLAASMVDYIDEDTVATTVNGGEPAGKELTPYVVMVAEKNTWLYEAPNIDGSWTAQIETQFFVQLWNPYTVPVEGDVRLEVFNRQYVEMADGGAQTDFNDYVPVSVSVSLRPNEFKAVAFDQVQQGFINFSKQPSTSSARYPNWPQTSSGASSLVGHPQFRFYWNGDLVDMNRAEPTMTSPASAGLPRASYNFPGGIGSIRWSFSFVPSNTPNTVADPRITYLCQSDWGSATSISTARWQGRQTDTAGRTQNLMTAWASRDFARTNSANFGATLASSNASPASLPSQYVTADANAAPSFIRNSSMKSIGELGHIFDPVQMNDTGGNVLGGNPQNYNRPGGGYTLRLGQPEFVPFDKAGSRAIELIDLFTVNATNEYSSGFPASKSRINVNTASQEVLEAMFYGIKVTSDSSSTNATINAGGASNLSQLVISNRPYQRLSDLYKITPLLVNSTNYSPSLGLFNAATNELSSSPAAAVFDRAREEAFGKVIELATTQSRAFRVYVVGQALGPNQKVQGQVALEASITILTTPAGKLVPVVSDIRWEN
jgi:type II secretory pathway component PulK